MIQVLLNDDPIGFTI